MVTRPRWCSVRLRFSAEEVALLKAAEVVCGDMLARQHDGAALREGLALMKAAQKVASADQNAVVSLAEADAGALMVALNRTAQQLERYRDVVMGWEASARMDQEGIALLERAFPTARGSAWAVSRVVKALRELAARLAAPLGDA